VPRARRVQEGAGRGSDRAEQRLCTSRVRGSDFRVPFCRRSAANEKKAQVEDLAKQIDASIAHARKTEHDKKMKASWHCSASLPARLLAAYDTPLPRCCFLVLQEDEGEQRSSVSLLSYLLGTCDCAFLILASLSACLMPVTVLFQSFAGWLLLAARDRPIPVTCLGHCDSPFPVACWMIAVVPFLSWVSHIGHVGS
jgi:hypothetical protein